MTFIAIPTASREAKQVLELHMNIKLYTDGKLKKK